MSKDVSELTSDPNHAFEVTATRRSAYRVEVRPGLLSTYGEVVRQVMPDENSRIIVLSDDRVFGLYGDRLLDSVRRVGLHVDAIQIPDGESSKSLDVLVDVLARLAASAMDRRGLLINFGGGVVSDLGGFAASAYMRGIAYANFSTSMIGQVDAAVGGKVAVNTEHAKNLIGAFHHPVHVSCDPVLLGTLSSRDFRSGMAEVIKVAMLGSTDLIAFLETHATAICARDTTVLTKLIGWAAELKMSFINRDPYERDLRRPLNFGHTLGHPIETEFAYRGVRHGEAVAVGMAVASLISLGRGWMSPAEGEWFFRLLRAYDLIACAPKIQADAVVRHLEAVKLIRGRRLNFVLPVSIGEVVITNEVSRGEILDAFARYTDLCQESGE